MKLFAAFFTTLFMCPVASAMQEELVKIFSSSPIIRNCSVIHNPIRQKKKVGTQMDHLNCPIYKVYSAPGGGEYTRLPQGIILDNNFIIVPCKKWRKKGTTVYCKIPLNKSDQRKPEVLYAKDKKGSLSQITQ